MDDDVVSGPFLPSPVPGDERLWPTELPFTAFGQFGVDGLDLRVFDQALYWVNRLGVAFLLEDMPDDYIANVIGFLCKHRDYYFGESLRRAVVSAVGDELLFGEPSGEVLAFEVGAPSWSELTAEEWLEGTPLMRRLRAIHAVNGGSGREDRRCGVCGGRSDE